MRKSILFITLAMISGLLFAESSQEMLNKAQLSWKSGDCGSAMAQMEKVKAKVNDFPEQMRPQIETIFSAWNDTVTKFENKSSQISMAIPSLKTAEGIALPLSELQSARKQIADLIVTSDEITCRDIRMKLQNKLFAYQDSANVVIDGYIDSLITKNTKLSAAVDSLRILARKYHQLLPIIDSLRALVAKNADRINLLQAQMDSIVAMATQSIKIIKGGPELGKTISSPTQTVSDALLGLVENKLVAIGEGKIRPRKFKEEQKDTIMLQLNEIATWLDTSMVAKSSPQRASALRELTYSYMDLLSQRPKPKPVLWIAIIAGVAIIAIIIIAVLQAFRRKKAK